MFLATISITEAKLLLYNIPHNNPKFLKISKGCRGRFNIFKRDGFKCNCCSRVASFVKVEQKSQSSVFLTLCALGKRKKHIQFTIDHVIPKSLGGSNSQENRQTMCEDCNTGKGNYIEEFKIVV